MGKWYKIVQKGHNFSMIGDTQDKVKASEDFQYYKALKKGYQLFECDFSSEPIKEVCKVIEE